MSFVSDVLANNFLAAKIESKVPLFRDDDDDNGEEEEEELVAARATTTVGTTGSSGERSKHSRKKARARRDAAPVVAEDEDSEASGGWYEDADDDDDDVHVDVAIGGHEDDFHRVAPASPENDDEDKDDDDDVANANANASARGGNHDGNWGEDDEVVNDDGGKGMSSKEGDDDDIAVGDGRHRDEEEEEETVTQGDIDWLIQEMENLQNDMEYLEEEELWERLAAIERENKRITELCGAAPINMNGATGAASGQLAGSGGGGGGGGGGQGVAGEVLGVVDGLGSLLITTVEQAKVQRDKAAELRLKIEKQVRDRAVLQDLDEWCDTLPEGGGAVNRSEWAARGFSDPITGYGRLRIHKATIKPASKPKPKEAQDVLASLEQQFPAIIRPTGAPEDLAKKEEESRLRSLAEQRGRDVIRSIDKALSSMEAGAQTIAANTAGGAASEPVAAALTWFTAQSDFVKRALAFVVLVFIVLTFVVQHVDDEEEGVMEEIDQGIGVSGRRLLRAAAVRVGAYYSLN